MNYATSPKSIITLFCTLFLSLTFNIGHACHGTGLGNASAVYNSTSDETVVEIEFCLGVTDLFGIPSDFQISFGGVDSTPTLSPGSTELTASYDFNLNAFFQIFFCNCDDATVGTPPTVLPNTDTWTANIDGTTISYVVTRSDDQLVEECQIDCVDNPPTGATGGDFNYLTDISACYVISVIFQGDVTDVLTNITMSGAENGTCDSENEMTFDFSGGGALAVDLSKFEAESKENSVDLNWTSSSEKDVYKYVVERSQNGVNQFEAIGNVVASGNSQSAKRYSFEDKIPLGKGFYRLKTVDIDGAITNSHVISVERNVADINFVNVYPNPIEGLTEIIYETKANSDIHFKVFDVNGALKADDIIDANSGYNRIPFDFTDLREGIYFIMLETGKEKIVKRVTKI